MKIIDVLNMMAKGEIKDQTTLKIYDHADTLYTSYTFEEKFNSFYSNTKYRIGLGDYFKISGDFLNYEVELIPSKPKKYLVKFNMRGLKNGKEYLNYDKHCGHVGLNDKVENSLFQTKFTKKELQGIQQVHEFLEDMQGKYELIEVDDDAID